MNDGDDFAVVVGTRDEPTAHPSGSTRSTFLVSAGVIAVLLITAIVITTRARDVPANSDEALTLRMSAWESTFNEGDVSGHLELFNESSVVGGQLLKLAADFEADLAWQFEWHPRMALSDCRLTAPRQSSCAYVRTDEFLGPLGLAETGVVEFALDPDDGKLARVDFRPERETLREIDDFHEQLYAWAESNHPEVALTGQKGSRDTRVWEMMRDGYLDDLSG